MIWTVLRILGYIFLATLVLKMITPTPSPSQGGSKKTRRNTGASSNTETFENNVDTLKEKKDEESPDHKGEAKVKDANGDTNGDGGEDRTITPSSSLDVKKTGTEDPQKSDPEDGKIKRRGNRRKRAHSQPNVVESAKRKFYSEIESISGRLNSLVEVLKSSYNDSMEGGLGGEDEDEDEVSDDDSYYSEGEGDGDGEGEGVTEGFTNGPSRSVGNSERKIIAMQQKRAVGSDREAGGLTGFYSESSFHNAATI